MLTLTDNLYLETDSCILGARSGVITAPSSLHLHGTIIAPKKSLSIHTLLILLISAACIVGLKSCFLLNISLFNKQIHT